MQKIESFEQFEKLTGAILKNKHCTNLYMFPEQINEHIKNKSLYFDDLQTDDVLIFYIEFTQFWKLYFYMKIIKELTVSPQNKPIVADIIYTEKQGEPESISKLRKSGFDHSVLYKQYSVKSADLYLPESDLDGYKIDYAKEEQIPEMLSILNKTFLDITNELPDIYSLTKRVREKNALCLVSPSGKVCGLSQWQRVNDTCLIKHTALVPEVRGKGLGKKLYIEVFRKSNAKHYKCWVAEGNMVKQQMDVTLGYRFNGKYMLKLIFAS